MKINKKLIGITVASLGMVFSIGGAIALYQTAADDVEFGISAGTYAGSSGSVTYKINNTSGNSNVAPAFLRTNGTNGGAGLSAEFTQVEYTMALSAEYANNANVQNYVVGNLSISLTNIPEAYRGKLAVWAVIDNYESASLGEHYYKNIFMNSDYQITAENQSFVANHDVAVSSAGTQVLHIYLKYNLAEIDTLTQNEASLGYTLAVSWGQPSNGFVPAYIKGNGNQWTEDDGYAMLPNINKAHAEGWEWIYNNLPGTIDQTKCFKAGEPDCWTPENVTLDPAKTYNVTWSGVNNAEANYQEIA